MILADLLSAERGTHLKAFKDYERSLLDPISLEQRQLSKLISKRVVLLSGVQLGDRIAMEAGLPTFSNAPFDARQLDTFKIETCPLPYGPKM